MKKITNEKVDYVIIGNLIIITGLLIILLAPSISDFFYIQRKITADEDKNTRIPETISPAFFFVIGVFTVIVGCAIFLRNLINTVSILLISHNDNET